MSSAASSVRSEPVADSGPASGTEPGPAAPMVPPGRWPVVVARGLAILSWTAAMATLLLVAWLPTVVRLHSGAVLRAGTRRRLKRVWARGLVRVAGVRVATAGQPPPAGALVVSNHLGYLDIPVLDSVIPMVFVARADLRRWPFWGPMASLGGTIYVDRATRRDVLRVRREMGEAMARGDSVIVFPEATTTGGDSILPFKPALLADAAEANTPVYWLTLSYRTPPDGPAARDQVCWWGDTGFLPHVLGLFALRRVECTMRFGDAPLRAGGREGQAGDRKGQAGDRSGQTDRKAHAGDRRALAAGRKALAAELRRAMLGNFEPVAGRETPPVAGRETPPVAGQKAPSAPGREAAPDTGRKAPPDPRE